MIQIEWTSERTEELMRLHQEGYSTAEIGRLWNVTKNAIVGKLHREKINRGMAMVSPRKGHRKVSATDKPRSNSAVLTLSSRAEFVSAYVAPPLPVPDTGQLASIVDVTGCRWPVRTDASFVGGEACCNHELAKKGSYCPYHAQQAIAHFSRSLIRSTTRAALAVNKVAA